MLIVSAFLLSACTAFVTKPEITLKEVRMVALDSEGIDLDFHLSVRNPNAIDLKLKDYSYDLKISSLPLAKGTSRTTYDFHANSATDLLIPVKIPYEGLIDILKRRPDPDAIPYQLHADLTIGSGIGNLTIPVNKSGTFGIPKEYRPTNIWKKVGDFLKGLEN